MYFDDWRESRRARSLGHSKCESVLHSVESGGSEIIERNLEEPMAIRLVWFTQKCQTQYESRRGHVSSFDHRGKGRPACDYPDLRRQIRTRRCGDGFVASRTRLQNSRVDKRDRGPRGTVLPADKLTVTWGPNLLKKHVVCSAFGRRAKR
jgi:hypothetical protein